MYLLGYDIGSSSVKASLVDAESGKCAASAFYPEKEAPIIAHKPGWAEQEPSMWWENLVLATKAVLQKSGADTSDIRAIGISYQMHGLVCVDRERKVLRPSIIWCDSRAVGMGRKAFESIGEEKCLRHLLNSPGNFTASKLAWVRQNEGELYGKIYKVMLPGDWIAMRMTGEIRTSVSGLSEGMFWDFRENAVADFLREEYGLGKELLADVCPTFGEQGELCREAASELGLREGTPVTYRAGDQPNNALSLNVFEPGEIASTAGTSGVVYGISDKLSYDRRSRVNIFAHVNHSEQKPRLGVLLCINGTGCLNSWMKRNVAPEGAGYEELNALAEGVEPGSAGISILPFGNGAERMLCDAEPGCSIQGVNFNIHSRAHLLRAAQEGIVFAFCRGIGIMREMGLKINDIHAGRANMFLSGVFRKTLALVTGARITLYDTDGAAGAAKGAGIGAGIYSSPAEAFASLEKVGVTEPDEAGRGAYLDAYGLWNERLDKIL